MANHKSAKKRIRQTLRKTEINKSKKGEVRTAVKKIREAMFKKDKDTALSLLPKTQGLLRKLAQNGIIKQNNASRKISRMASQISSL